MLVAFIIYGATALLMIGIGISQINSKKPVGFFSGEEPPKAEDITDLRAWNKKHGMMWIIYGAFIIFSAIIGYFINDPLLAVIPLSCGMILPVILMVLYHDRLVKKYIKSNRT